jgi:predicted DNA-binding protein
MKRTNIHLSEQQLKRLEQQSRKTGLSVAEIVRRAIDDYLEKINATR